jgi:outer membrane biogenesis lipoprotein LolB|tara:strand:- start:18 stop:329 length:312 start_codon:yes stop_codon:yes gene_type:complete
MKKFLILIVILLLSACSDGGKKSVYKITSDEYNRLRKGMSYSQVVEIVGEDGKLISTEENVIFRMKQESYKWENYDGTYAVLLFSNLGNTYGILELSDFYKTF